MLPAYPQPLEWLWCGAGLQNFANPCAQALGNKAILVEYTLQQFSRAQRRLFVHNWAQPLAYRHTSSRFRSQQWRASLSPSDLPSWQLLITRMHRTGPT